MKTRSSGILLHISSLPGKYGIGDFGEEAYNFVDFLVESKQKNWQILPLGITGYGNSPYQNFSAFAGNPYFIDLDQLIEENYLSLNEVMSYDLGQNEIMVDYSKLYINKIQLLRIAYNNFLKCNNSSLNLELEEFYESNSEWLREFALYMSIKTKNENKSWLEWDIEFKESNSDAVLNFEVENQDDIYFWVFTQYYFLRQWSRLKEYANSKNINIIGDLPIYVAVDSSDVWSNPQYYNLDHNYNPITVAGCPPDEFATEGQLWGNPIYRWEKLEEDGYQWWIKRLKRSFQLYDIVRLDHFIGFENYYEVAYGSSDAINGSWKSGPGMKLFSKIKEELGDLKIIVEDLGNTTDAVKKLVCNTGYPNMKVLQFGFDPYAENDHTPHRIGEHSLIYTGTHDNHTTIGWLKNITPLELDYVKEYLELNVKEGFNWGVIKAAWRSTSYLAIAPMQDFLGLDDKARMNTPSTIGENWTWRMKKSDMTEELSKKIAEITKIYWR